MRPGEMVSQSIFLIRKEAAPMKKTIGKTLAIAAATLTMAAVSAASLLSVAAEEPVSPVEPQMTAASGGEESVSLLRDDIVVKYRMYNGKLQYRRWNQTTGSWVDSDWIDV